MTLVVDYWYVYLWEKFYHSDGKHSIAFCLHQS